MKTNREAAVRARRENAKAINCKSLLRRRREDGELPPARIAIQNFCRECMGFDGGGSGSLAEAINKCPSPQCWLYPWRNGKLDKDA